MQRADDHADVHYDHDVEEGLISVATSSNTGDDPPRAVRGDRRAVGQHPILPGPGLNASASNPNNLNPSNNYPRGEILAADGTVLAYSVKAGTTHYPYRRVYPEGSLTSGVVGFFSPYYGVWGTEEEYNSFLAAHPQPPQSFEQLLAPTSAADSVTLTIVPALQQVARTAMKGIDGAAVAIDPRTGAVLVMYSNPNYNPVPLTSPIATVAKAAWDLDEARQQRLQAAGSGGDPADVPARIDVQSHHHRGGGRQ